MPITHTLTLWHVYCDLTPQSWQHSTACTYVHIHMVYGRQHTYAALHFSNNTKQINFLSNLCKKQKAVENCVKRKSENGEAIHYKLCERKANRNAIYLLLWHASTIQRAKRKAAQERKSDVGVER